MEPRRPELSIGPRDELQRDLVPAAEEEAAAEEAAAAPERRARVNA